MPFKDHAKQLEYMRKYTSKQREMRDRAELSLDLIDPSPSPIRDVEGAVIVELRESIRNLGVLQPILVRPKENGRYEIVFGNHRFYAAKGAGLTCIPAQIRQMADLEAMLLSVTENIQRLEMNPVREGEVYKKLSEGGYSVHALAEKLGKSEGYIKGRIDIFEKLSPNLKQKLGKELALSVAIAISKLPIAQQESVFDEVNRNKNSILAQHNGSKFPSLCGGGNYTEGIPLQYCTCEKCGAKHWRGIDANCEGST